MINRRKRLHQILLALINKSEDFELIDEDSTDITSVYSEKETINLVEKNRKVIMKYQSLVRSAVTLDALMDSENEENYKIK